MMAFRLDGGDTPFQNVEWQERIQKEVRDLLTEVVPKSHKLLQNAPLPQLIDFANKLLRKFMKDGRISPEIRSAVAAFRYEQDEAEKNAGKFAGALEKISIVIQGAVEIILKGQSSEKIRNLALAQDEQYKTNHRIFLAWKKRAAVAAKFLEQMEFIACTGGFAVLNEQHIEEQVKMKNPPAFGNLTLEKF